MQRGKPKIDKEIAVALRKEGYTYQEIAEKFNTDKSCVYRGIKNLLPNDTTQIYKERRADILAKLQADILESIQPEDIKKAPMGSRVLAACQLYDKERTERGLTNSISAVIHSDIEALRSTSKGPDYAVIDIDGD